MSVLECVTGIVWHNVKKRVGTEKAERKGCEKGVETEKGIEKGGNSTSVKKGGGAGSGREKVVMQKVYKGWWGMRSVRKGGGGWGKLRV